MCVCVYVCMCVCVCVCLCKGHMYVCMCVCVCVKVGSYIAKRGLREHILVREKRTHSSKREEKEARGVC